jgi:hypothetical protein
MIARLSSYTPIAPAASWAGRRPPTFERGAKSSPDYAAACMALETQARKTVLATIKSRARAFLAEPWQLDMLCRRFDASLMTPSQLIAFATEVLRQETSMRRLELVRLINAKAAILAGRLARAKEHQTARKQQNH